LRFAAQMQALHIKETGHGISVHSPDYKKTSDNLPEAGGNGLKSRAAAQ
jgi:hypothetical protein